MIVLTGPGRSGTSLLATLYRQLGFDPGGAWNPQVSAGMEEGQVAWMNLHLAEELGVSIRERRGGRTLRAAGSLVRLSHGRIPGALRRRFASAVDTMRYSRVAPDLMRWDAIADVAERHGEELRALAKDRAVLKDPRFMWTLRAWLASGVPVDAVVLTVRPLDAMADSRVRAGMYTPRARAWGKHNYCYGLGLLHTAVAEYRIPLVTLRFPDWVEKPEELYRLLPMPEPRTWEQFREAFDTVYDSSLVHDRR